MQSLWWNKPYGINHTVSLIETFHLRSDTNPLML
uniref:Uncharacterized protein n=1 Tax=Ascaris lumbricoides TaxID=6252 RepID=A0A0M3HH25_ASCLU